jgi:hypothetical protein
LECWGIRPNGSSTLSYFFQFYTRELSFEERLKLETDNEDFIDDITSKDWPIGVKQIAEETLNEKTSQLEQYLNVESTFSRYILGYLLISHLMLYY